MSCGKYNDEIVVCSRNLSLKYEDEYNQQTNAFVKTALKLNVIEGLKILNRNVMISGELIGPGIQGNKYQLDDYQWRIFDVYDAEKGQYMHLGDRLRLVAELSTISGETFHQVAPIIDNCHQFEYNVSVTEILQMASDKSQLNPKMIREGLVFKSLNNPDLSFKAISPAFSMKFEDG
jgi:ATP-dependent RNA circularization protein (DNA/RNA ligase family)